MDLEQRAREQDEHWRGIVSQKEQLISKLQQHASNGEQVRATSLLHKYKKDLNLNYLFPF